MNNKLRHWLRIVKRTWKSVDAQDLVEYALLLLLVALAVGATVKSFGTRVSSTFLGAAMSVAEMNFPANASTSSVVGAGLSNTAAVDNQAATVNGNAALADAFDAFTALFSSAAASRDYSAAASAAANAAGLDARAATEAAAGNFAAAAADTASANQDAALAAQDVASATGKVNVSATGLISGLVNTGFL
jgi:Flp pilus assembly pilin Flp